MMCIRAVRKDRLSNLTSYGEGQHFKHMVAHHLVHHPAGVKWARI